MNMEKFQQLIDSLNGIGAKTEQKIYLSEISFNNIREDLNEMGSGGVEYKNLKKHDSELNAHTLCMRGYTLHFIKST